MRSGLNSKRPRNNRNNMRRGGGSQNRSHTFDSSGPDVKLRGSANQIFEKYLALSRDAHSSGDRVMAENYQQHAEHYFRLINNNANANANANGSGQQQHQQRSYPPQVEGSSAPQKENAKADGGEAPGEAEDTPV